MPYSADYSNQSTIIIGASGFLGRNLCRYFDDKGWAYTAIGRDAGDLTDPARCEALLRDCPPAGTIFHLATFQRTGFRQYEIPADLLDVNARMHLNVLSAWAKHQPGAKLVSTGSSCFYPEQDTPIPESALQSGPLHDSVRAYGLAKTMLAVGSEVYATQYDLHWLHCVLATMYGPYDHVESDRSHFVIGMMRRAMEEQQAGGRTYTVWGSPDTVRECLHVTDQIEAILAANGHFENQILNCATNKSVTIDEVARAVLTVLDWEAEIEYSQDAFKGTSRKTIDSTPFLDGTGWRSRISLHEGLADLAEFLAHDGNQDSG